MLTVRLTQAGHQIFSAFDAYQGLAIARKEKPDIVLLDLMLPAGGGLIVLKNMRMSSHLGNIPVIAMTATNSPEKEKEALAAGADAFIKKPYDFDELKGLILKLSNKTE